MDAVRPRQSGSHGESSFTPFASARPYLASVGTGSSSAESTPTSQSSSASTIVVLSSSSAPSPFSPSGSPAVAMSPHNASEDSRWTSVKYFGECKNCDCQENEDGSKCRLNCNCHLRYSKPRGAVNLARRKMSAPALSRQLLTPSAPLPSKSLGHNETGPLGDSRVARTRPTRLPVSSPANPPTLGVSEYFDHLQSFLKEPVPPANSQPHRQAAHSASSSEDMNFKDNSISPIHTNSQSTVNNLARNNTVPATASPPMAHVPLRAATTSVPGRTAAVSLSTTTVGEDKKSSLSLFQQRVVQSLAQKGIPAIPSGPIASGPFRASRDDDISTAQITRWTAALPGTTGGADFQREMQQPAAAMDHALTPQQLNHRKAYQELFSQLPQPNKGEIRSRSKSFDISREPLAMDGLQLRQNTVASSNFQADARESQKRTSQLQEVRLMPIPYMPAPPPPCPPGFVPGMSRFAAQMRPPPAAVPTSDMFSRGAAPDFQRSAAQWLRQSKRETIIHAAATGPAKQTVALVTATKETEVREKSQAMSFLKGIGVGGGKARIQPRMTSLELSNGARSGGTPTEVAGDIANPMVREVL
ncbi:hypothetical protein DFJ73DRAFT_834061, partial [Zopfochytrium polystomum]